MIAQCTGARPRYFGSSEPCMFNAPRRGSASHAALKQVAVIERKHEVRPRAATLGDPLDGVRIIGRFHPQAVCLGQLLHAAEPLVLARIIGMGKKNRDVHVLRQELAHTPHPHLAVSEHHRTRHGATLWPRVTARRPARLPRTLRRAVIPRRPPPPVRLRRCSAVARGPERKCVRRIHPADRFRTRPTR